MVDCLEEFIGRGRATREMMVDGDHRVDSSMDCVTVAEDAPVAGAISDGQDPSRTGNGIPGPEQGLLHGAGHGACDKKKVGMSRRGYKFHSSG